MAIDSALKRASAINVGSPWRGVLPLPDGTVGQDDMQTVALHYAGILATAAIIYTPPSVRFTPGANATFTPARNATFTPGAL